MPNGGGIARLIGLNESHSRLFRESGAARIRHQTRSETEVGGSFCSDGRVNMALATQMPIGSIHKHRNIGAVFDLFEWPLYRQDVENFVLNSLRLGRRCLYLPSFHFSANDIKRGCKGHKHDTSLAISNASSLAGQFKKMFIPDELGLLVIGINTDLDELVLLKRDGSLVHASSLMGLNDESLLDAVYQSNKHLPRAVAKDFLWLLKGNLNHIQELRQRPRGDFDNDHQESVVAIGQGLDWLYTYNLGLIVGPYDPNLGAAIKTAAEIVWDNIRQQRVNPDEGIVIIASAQYDSSIHFKRNGAIIWAKDLMRIANQIIANELPEFAEYADFMSVVTDLNTRQMEIIERSDK